VEVPVPGRVISTEYRHAWVIRLSRADDIFERQSAMAGHRHQEDNATLFVECEACTDAGWGERGTRLDGPASGVNLRQDVRCEAPRVPFVEASVLEEDRDESVLHFDSARFGARRGLPRLRWRWLESRQLEVTTDVSVGRWEYTDPTRLEDACLKLWDRAGVEVSAFPKTAAHGTRRF
jgi:hypothetical protein